MKVIVQKLLLKVVFMNEKVILNMVRPYVINNCLLYSNFLRIFDMLSVKEQCSVSEVLEKNGITVLDVDDEMDNNFEIMYDPSIFIDDFNVFEEGKEKETYSYLNINKKLKQSNEILCVLIQKGDIRARQDLCVANHGLVSKIVKKYIMYFGQNLEFDELVQAGMIGILKAAEKFDITKDFKFTTYATHWILQSIIREIDNYGFAIRIPSHTMGRIASITKLERKYEMQGLNYNQRLEAISNEKKLNVEYIKYCMLLKEKFLNVVSLDTPIGEDKDTTLVEYIASQDEPVESIAEEAELRNIINEVLSTLTDKEQKILMMRFGLNGSEPHTLESIGQKFNITRERIRQIQEKALRKIRQPSSSHKLKDFYIG